jgi:hypothetical protein
MEIGNSIGLGEIKEVEEECKTILGQYMVSTNQRVVNPYRQFGTPANPQGLPQALVDHQRANNAGLVQKGTNEYNLEVNRLIEKLEKDPDCKDIILEDDGIRYIKIRKVAVLNFNTLEELKEFMSKHDYRIFYHSILNMLYIDD